MVELRPKGFKPSGYMVCIDALRLPEDYKQPCFVIHPPTHELAESLVVDSTALDNERYSGVYDAEGDYIPQYAENPDEVPQGSIVANSEGNTPPAPTGGAEDPNKNSSLESTDASSSGDTK